MLMFLSPLQVICFVWFCMGYKLIFFSLLCLLIVIEVSVLIVEDHVFIFYYCT